MNDDALPVFRQICKAMCARGGGGITLEQIRDSAGLAEALVISDEWRISEFAARLELSAEDVQEIMAAEGEHDEGVNLAPGTAITDQTALGVVSESATVSGAHGRRAS